MFRLVFRTTLISIARFVAILALVIFTQHFEVSPLPEWTLMLFAYLMQTLITYAAAIRVFRKRTPGTRETVVVIALFVFLELFYETVLFLYLTGYDWAGLPSNFRWPTLALSVLYVLATVAAALRAKRKNSVAAAPEGMVS